ncbi:hypothetical protein B0A64_09155 [Flavobacterium araucananum]|uniref:Uncharacterized protein n=1 Tax=Flavobacterium araucananum TaxID=946678 RepID=A0A227PAP5_9FLAO|nr:hypothetical protein B0A64_09155 [Flavobacterium araucananum]
MIYFIYSLRLGCLACLISPVENPIIDLNLVPNCCNSIVQYSLAPIVVEILLCRGSAQKIGTDSGKKLQKNNIKPKKIQQKITTRTTVILKTKSKTQKAQVQRAALMTRRTPVRNPKAAPKT